MSTVIRAHLGDLTDDALPAVEVLRRWREVSWHVYIWHDQVDTPAAMALTEGLSRYHPGVAILDFRRLQSVCSRFKDVMLVHYDPAKEEDGDAGGGAAKDADDQSGTETADGACVTFLKHREKGGGTRGRRRSHIVVNMPQPKADYVARVRRALERLYQQAREDAQETLPERWAYRNLAMRQEMGQLDPARVWRQEAMETYVILLDVSGSMGGFVQDVMALGAAITEACPWLIVAAAPNGEPEPLFPGKLAMLRDGRNFVPRGWPNVTWPQVMAEAGAVGCLYVGDWEYWILDQFPGRHAVISNYCCRAAPVQLTDRLYGQVVGHPAVMGCGDTKAFITGIELLADTGSLG